MNRLHVFWITPGGAMRDTGEVYDADDIGYDQPTDALFSSFPLNHVVVQTTDIVDEDDEYDAIGVERGLSMPQEPVLQCRQSNSGYDPSLHHPAVKKQSARKR